jgi:hypothetical protein
MVSPMTVTVSPSEFKRDPRYPLPARRPWAAASEYFALAFGLPLTPWL